MFLVGWGWTTVKHLMSDTSGWTPDVSGLPDVSNLPDVAKLLDVSDLPDVSIVPDVSHLPDVSIGPDVFDLPYVSDSSEALHCDNMSSDRPICSQSHAHLTAIGPPPPPPL